jgi:hypothetical protein
MLGFQAIRHGLWVESIMHWIKMGVANIVFIIDEM